MTNDLSIRQAQGFQRRTFGLAGLELRDGSSPDVVTFEGVACTVDHAYEVRDAFGTYSETIAAGAFARTLGNPDNRVSLFVNHNHRAIPLATRRAGTLKLTADPNLRVTASLDANRPDVQVLRSAVSRGEISEMSIGFADVAGGDVWNETFTQRTVTELALREVSAVEQGANDVTAASVRSVVDELMRVREVDLAPAEIERAIAHLRSLLADEEAENSGEIQGKSLDVVTPEMIALLGKRF